MHEYGVSIVNVGSTAYKRYVNIFRRKDRKRFNMPLSIITDLDIRSIEYYEDPDNKGRKEVFRVTEETKKNLMVIATMYNGKICQCFYDEDWNR